jgi:hypothetical protein
MLVRILSILSGGAMLLLIAADNAIAQQAGLKGADHSGGEARSHETNGKTPADVLSPNEWQRVDAAVSRALRWLDSQQQPDGSFPTIPTGQPGVTSLCTMAFMAHGHMPDEGIYGLQLVRATDFVLTCQKQSGLIALVGPDSPRINRNIPHEIGTCAAYDHAISALALSELYGMTDRPRAKRLETAINRALRATLEMQRWPKDNAAEIGGWRYIDDDGTLDSDLSITGWQLMFLRSARNGGFDVPKEAIDSAVDYVRRAFCERYGAFGYANTERDYRSRGMAGAGILAFAHAGFHNAPEAKRSADWLMQFNFDDYNRIEKFNQPWFCDRYHYGLFNCSQAMYQLGGKYWEQFFPRAVEAVLANQGTDGSWQAESHFHDAQFGNAYTTALVVLLLGAPNQLLPIYQR